MDLTASLLEASPDVPSVNIPHTAALGTPPPITVDVTVLRGKRYTKALSDHPSLASCQPQPSSAQQATNSAHTLYLGTPDLLAFGLS